MGQKIKHDALHAVNGSEIVGDPCKYSKSDSQDDFIYKKFSERNSLLTDMSQLNHIYAINKIIVAFLFSFFFKEITLHLVGAQELDFAFDLILWNFGGIGTTFVYWMGMFASSVSFYYGFNFWAGERRKLLKQSEKKTIVKKWDYCCLSLMISFMVAFLMVPCILLLDRNLPLVSAVIIYFEQVRFMMKIYAFSRSNIPNVIKNCEDKKFLKDLADLSKFIYFLFAPTLIYRSDYPRKNNIDWKSFIWNIISVATVIFFWANIFKRCFISPLQDFSGEKLSWKILTRDIVNSIIPILVLHLISFLLLLHSWMNAFAEIMQFADRMFYEDWWTCSNFSRFFRTWNLIVGDWLYIYIYKDIAFLTAIKNKDTGVYKRRPIIPRIAVFIVSAFFHEYILAATFKFLYPIQFIMFAFVGGFMASINKTTGDIYNVWMIFSIALGEAIMFTLYCNEWYARKNCPAKLTPVPPSR